MTCGIVAGLDGSRESRSAAEWAAGEALLRDAPLRVVHAWEWQPYAYAPLAGVQTTQPPMSSVPADESEPPLLDAVRDDLTHRHPGLPVATEELSEPPSAALLHAARDAELLVLGSRGLSTVAGFLVGSVALHVVAHAICPVVLVGAREHAAGERVPRTMGAGSGMAWSQVVLGLDIRRPAGPVIDFAFAAAAHRTTRLCVIHGWSPSGRDANDNTPDTGGRDARRELKELLRPWREKFPGVEVTEQAVVGKAAAHLVDASGGAALLVVGRRSRHSHLGGHIGAVTHTVMHHSHAPVAVVPHG